MHCTQCKKPFQYFPGEKEAYAKFDAPLSGQCPDCRQLRRLAFRNEKNLYYNKSSKSGKTIITLYPSSSPFKIIDQDEWWDDDFDATQYGMDFDFTKPFFEQFKTLQKNVPRWSRIFVNCENSDFTNNCANVKNGYLSFSSYESDSIFYCTHVHRLNHCIDCFNVKDSEYCVGCMDCKKNYKLHYSQLSESCSDSYFLFDCRNCKNCILCTQQRNQEYMILNQKYSKTDYAKHKKKFLQQFKALKKQTFFKNMRLLNAENSWGDFINDSKNILNGFYIEECEDCINVFDCSKLKNCYDNFTNDLAELCLEADTSYQLYRSKFCTYVGTSSDVEYCDQCFHLEHCFGCIGLKKQKYVILNKKYSKGDYENLRTRITAHMKKIGEYGKPFPANLSSFAYNITTAQDVSPLDKLTAEEMGFQWYQEEKEATYLGEPYKIPAHIQDIDDSICDKILTCEETGKNYKIIPQELKLYKMLGLPLPRTCPDQRYRAMLKMQPPKKLTDTTCSMCGIPIQTVYPKSWERKVVCEKCYLEKTY